MHELPVDRLSVEKHGKWVSCEDHRGVTHLAWKWNGGVTIGYLCCTEPEWLEDVALPRAALRVTCMACMGTVV